MVAITTRESYGAELPWQVVDANFINLATAIDNVGADVLAEAIVAKDAAVLAATASQSAASGANSSAIAAAASAAQSSAYVGSLTLPDGASKVGFDKPGSGTVQKQLDMLYYGIANIMDTQYAGGAKNDKTYDSSTAILAAKADAEANKKVFYIPPGEFMMSEKMVVKPRSTYRGAGEVGSFLYFTGSGCLESQRGIGAVDQLDLQDFTVDGLLSSATSGISLGTARQSLFQNLRSRNFLIPVDVDIIGVSTGNYWNRFICVTAEGPGRGVAGSAGFRLGNNYSSGSTFPDTDYNIFIGCRSYTCETAVLAINAIGCRMHDHHSVVVGTALTVLAGNDNYFQMTCENVLNLGSAAAGTISNIIDIYNDGGLSTPFSDLGWNHIVPRNIASSITPVPLKTLDSFVQDRVLVTQVGTSIPLFKLQLSAHEAVATVTIAYSGYTTGVKDHSGVAVWDVFKTGGGTPKVALVRSTGPSGGSASFSGATMTVVSGQYSTGQTLTGVGLPAGTVISAITVGGGGPGSTATINYNVGTIGALPVGAADTLLSVSAASNGDVQWNLAGNATAQIVFNAVVNVQGGGTPQTFPYKSFNQYVRLV